MLVGENPFSKILARLERAEKEALPIAAEVILTESIKWVPIFSGRLRQSWSITSDGTIIFDTPYARRQYYEPLRHVDGGGVPISLADAISEPEKRNLTKTLGSNPNARYARLYRAAENADLLQVIYPDGLRWIYRASKDPEIMRMAQDVIANFVLGRR